MPCAIAPKMLHWFRVHIDRCRNNDNIHMHFENFWENTCCSSQFKNGEACSRIDGSHVKKFIERVNGLVDVINKTHSSNTCIKNFTALLKLLPSLYAFWTEVTIESYDSYLEKIESYKNDINLFHKHGRDTIFANAYVGDGETFYLHCAKFHVPRIARDALEVLGCGVGISTMQGFEHRNKESKYVYSNKTNRNRNCCKQVLKAMHRLFLNKQLQANLFYELQPKSNVKVAGSLNLIRLVQQLLISQKLLTQSFLLKRKIIGSNRVTLKPLDKKLYSCS